MKTIFEKWLTKTVVKTKTFLNIEQYTTLLTPSFGICSFAYHCVLKHPFTNIGVLKCAAKNENRITNTNLTNKNVLDLVFCM